MKKLILPVIALALCGCASIKHERDIVVDGKVVGRETEKASGFFMKAAVDGLRSSTKDGNYTHTFTAKSATAVGDAEMITATSAALGNLIGTAAAATAKGAVKP